MRGPAANPEMAGGRNRNPGARQGLDITKNNRVHGAVPGPSQAGAPPGGVYRNYGAQGSPLNPASPADANKPAVLTKGIQVGGSGQRWSGQGRRPGLRQPNPRLGPAPGGEDTPPATVADRRRHQQMPGNGLDKSPHGALVPANPQGERNSYDSDGGVNNVTGTETGQSIRSTPCDRSVYPLNPR